MLEMRDGHTLRFEVVPIDRSDSRRIRLFVDGGVDPVAEEIETFSFDASTRATLAAIMDGTASEGQVLVGGNALWERLRTGAVGAALEPLRGDGGKLHIRLALHSVDEALPWEGLVDELRKRLAAASNYVLVRDPDRRLVARERRVGPLSLLTVVPGRTRLRVDPELDAIRRAFEDHGVQVQYGEPLRDRVTVDTLRDHLERKLRADGAPYEILHVSGHGVLGTDGVPKLVLNDEGSGNFEMSPSSFASLLEDQPPRLVVLNACYSGAGAEAKGLVGFGQELLGAGVHAVVAMQRAIRDDLAIDFSVAFYSELARTGRADAGVTMGRRRLHQKQGVDTATAFSIPVLFEVPGGEPLFDQSGWSRREPVIEKPLSPVPAKPGIRVPPTVVNAVRQGWCIPVLGPCLTTPSRDAGGTAWSPGALAMALSEQSQLHEPAIIAGLAQIGERLEHMVLQRICEQLQKLWERPPLNAEIQRLLTAVEVVPKVYDSLARWPVPGFVCSHFDGLLVRAFDRRGRAFHAIHAPDEYAPPPEVGAPLILHLRGSTADEATLCLTGPDHDRLLDAMMRMGAKSSSAAGLVAARNGTCLLLLGATAWDPWLRHLLWRMVPRDSFENHTLYIVQPHATEADRAAWGGFSVQWIDEAPEDVVAAITERVSEARA